jgi:hypothetical protein
MRTEESRFYVVPVSGTCMEPVLPDGSINLFKAGIDGCHRGKIVCLGRFTDNGTLESRAVGVIAMDNMESSWPEQALRLEFLKAGVEPIVMNERHHRYRIISEWVTVLDKATYAPITAGAFQTPSSLEGPSFNEWLTVSKQRVISLAASNPVPPEVFAKYPELVERNPTLSHALMTNFWSFDRWVNQHPAILGRLKEAGQAVKIPGGSPISQMIATEWVTRGQAFQQWYGEVIAPLCSN